MPRFGFLKDDDDGSSSKSSLFSRKKDSRQDANPYAQQGQQDPYMASRGGRAGLPSGPGPRGPAPASVPPSRASANEPPPAYGSQAPAGGPANGGYSAGGYGAAGGYGSNRYDSNSSDVKRMNEETRYLRNETDQSLDRSLMIANQTIETARSTMARMHNQRDRLYNVEQNLDQAANHNKIAEHRTAELKHYNRSMFAVKVSNPFMSKQRAAERAQAALDEHRTERQIREETRRAAYLSNRNADDEFSQLDKTIDSSRRLGQNRKGVSSKFTLEDDDEEDIAMEQRIDNKLGLLSGAVGTLNEAAVAMGKGVEEDLVHLDRIMAKSDNVDDGVRANRYRLERIEKKG
ncbi:plasma membrane snare protein [Grosmannia clavigera kw1407]|uniref:Plasma membrane snare protein n=1 Tax=Grosmannia clavigera (strain kw1407 / UAMH 11150) TaxID=655863 RepID=F0XIM3_GROCL|nr:plasma membrane snare protein [Grosmannia clavigera kw1407]EFX02457.1 plasma membrane snare protein [Grosmannia clavigera kw1407]